MEGRIEAQSNVQAEDALAVEDVMLSDKAKAEIQGYVGKWRPRLRLLDWSIAYEWDAELDKNSAMSCDVQPQYRRFCLKLSADTKDDHWATVEKQVLHELCHAVTEEPMEMLTRLMNRLQLGRSVFEALDTSVRFTNERATEWLARVVWEAYEKVPWDAE